MQERMGISDLWTAWPVCGPWRLAPLPGGTNNAVWRADAADGQSSVLRLSTDLSRAPRLRYEAQLLQALADAGLPFLLPIPLRAIDGDVVVSFVSEHGIRTLATLSPLLPGSLHDRPPERHDLRCTSRAAQALAVLDQALAALPDIRPPHGYVPLPVFGDAARWNPLITDPLAAVGRLPVAGEQIKQVQAFLSEVQEQAPELYVRLPQQVLHRDYDPANILLNQQQVTAVLDFEFAGRDIRVLDLGVALSWWPIHILGTGQEWELISTFGAAYTRQLALSEAELLALPAVFRLREALSLVHRLGRYLAGMETTTRIQRRVEHTLWREAWLSMHRETLLDHALAWV